MKKRFITLFLLILLVSPLVLATEETSEASNGETADGEVEDVYQNRAGIPAFTFLFSEFPGFYLKLSWAEFAVYLMASAFLFVGALEILSYTAFESGWVKALIAAGLLVITIITGAISKLTNMFFNILDNFKIIAWATVILIIILLLAHPIFNAIKKNKRLSKAEELGIAAGATLRGLKKTAETAAKTSN
ncbi:MAG: hypothetical protein KKF50_01465 [Nanoarchaeota archaeon]|nr:hypothetical protein [Nanoarchaeota archaeon]